MAGENAVIFLPREASCATAAVAALPEPRLASMVVQISDGSWLPYTDAGTTQFRLPSCRMPGLELVVVRAGDLHELHGLAVDDLDRARLKGWAVDWVNQIAAEVFTSLAVTACPLDHFAFGCRWTVSVLPSADTDQEAARPGRVWLELAGLFAPQPRLSTS